MEDVSSRIVKKAIGLGCQDAIADVITNRSYQIRFAQNEAVISNQWREPTASVFFLYDKRVLPRDHQGPSRGGRAAEPPGENPEGPPHKPGHPRDARAR